MSKLVPMDEKNKKIIIAISVALIVLILVAIPTIIVLLNDNGDPGEKPDGDSLGDGGEINLEEYVDTDEIISGTYSMSINGSGVGGSAEYAFNGKNVIHKYTDDGAEITIEYTYVIAKNGKGNKIIKFTEVGTEEMEYHEYYNGKGPVQIDGVWKTKEFISINDSWYYIESES